MKKLFLLAALLMPAAHADLMHKMTSSTQITVDGAYTIAERGASTYSVSGSNIKVASTDDHFGKLIAPASATAAATLDAGTYDINTAGAAYSFQESFIGGDALYAVGNQKDTKQPRPPWYNYTRKGFGNYSSASALIFTYNCTTVPRVCQKNSFVYI